MDQVLTLSIITVNLNNNIGLIKTIESVKQQAFNDYEHLIIDAGSTDESRETILKYSKESNSHLTFWVSESDKGIYDGMNKGIRYAKGEYLYFLNSGDCLINGVLEAVPFDSTQYMYGNIKAIYTPQKIVDWIYPDIFDTYFLANENGWLSQQACFIHHSLFMDHQYDTNYKIISDWIHAIRCILLEGCSYKHLPFFIAEYDGNGESSDLNKTMNERKEWIKKNIPDSFYSAFVKLNEYNNSGLEDIIPLISKTHKFKKRIKKVITFLYQINSIFTSHSVK